MMCRAILISKNGIINTMNVIIIKYDLKMDLQNYEGMYINRDFPDYSRVDLETISGFGQTHEDNCFKIMNVYF